MAEESACSGMSSNSSAFPRGLGPGLLQSWAATAHRDAAAVMREFLHTVPAWARFLAAALSQDRQTGISVEPGRALAALLMLSECYQMTIANLLCVPEVDVWHKFNQQYGMFRDNVDTALGTVGGNQDDMAAYCMHQGFEDFVKAATLPPDQLHRWPVHMAALVWLAVLMSALFRSEVEGRVGLQGFPWSRKRVCNYLNCPTSRAYQAAQRQGEPDVQLAFEAFADKKLRKCSDCEHAWYCSAECQQATWKRHKPFCKAAQQSAA
ncbi:hypothetical protein WJX72_007960 [[Myrmecia] bisecta]|uniref:MYND-type domain-containing protein n=1 Tax=[Myrmecia] bisecta TaxID=41462 RepID=A0AAW1PUT0_9CHLO